MRTTMTTGSLRDPGFWLTLAVGLTCIGLFLYWLCTGARTRNNADRHWIGGVMLKEGSQAPAFTVLDDHERKVSLSDYLGRKNVVLFFFPKADTPG